MVGQTESGAAEAPFVLRQDRDAVATLTLNRPASYNALSADMMTALQQALDEIAADRAVAVVVLRAEGKGFCGGHDLKEMQAHRNDADRGVAFYEALFAQCSRLMQAITALPQPVIAEVQGVATAAGCQLVASCDLAVAGTSARFGVNGIDVGFFCSTPMVALSRNVGPKKVFELLTTGRLMPAEEAEAAGLVNRVVADADLRGAAEEFAAAIAAKSAAVVALGKQAFYRQLELDRETAYDFTSKVMVRNLLLRDCEEGFSAFIEKRKPKWENR
ncbi:MAG TPA: enoyl-CoA hydratase [Hyphomicrobiales bacterium]|nr:enoyl-CoA hydratase [Hyphomicrobiales bacterium]